MLYVQTLRKARNKTKKLCAILYSSTEPFLYSLLYDSRFWYIKHNAKPKLFMDMQVSFNNIKRLLCRITLGMTL